MAVIQVTVYRPLAGRYQEFLQRVAEGKKIIESQGARFRAIAQQSGPRPNSTAVVVEYDDLAQFAEVVAKLQSDSAFQALTARIQSDPTAEVLETSLNQDIPIP